ncbi:hypothetical protein [Salipaludibacillus daqingensis]|uniref:hypothetical protein n=1 Tax=Salipaludibacillus daqingensis TaxID=3041001 RepID=UPI002474B446|nr:hypothetical protein [Salipaludibacillus daqingensis]
MLNLFVIGTGIIIFFIVLNLIVIKIAGEYRKGRVIAGIIVLLISPVIFYSSLFIGAQFDDGGFGTGIITLFFTTLVVLNGSIILFVGLFTKPTQTIINKR